MIDRNLSHLATLYLRLAAIVLDGSAFRARAPRPGSNHSVAMIPDSNSYVLIWFDEMRRKKLPYREPLVDDATVRLVKVSCSSMKQDAHVFVQAVETLEDYISAKGGLGDEDAVLSAVCAVFLCSKHAGGQSDLRTGVVKEFLDKLVGSR